MTRSLHGGALVLLLLAAACGGGDDAASPGSDQVGVRPDAGANAVSDSAEAADHSARGAGAGETTPASAHSTHPAATPSDAHGGHAAQTSADAGAHATHTARAASGTAAHAAHAPAATPSTEHASHVTPPARPADSRERDSGASHAMHADSTTEAGMSVLLALLLSDPGVQERIRTDPELSRLWADSTVRSHVMGSAHSARDMALLMDLVQSLLADPAVITRIEADSALRELWSDPAVREWLRRMPR